MTRISLDERVVALAATSEPDDADDLSCSWRYHQTLYTNAELERLYVEYVSYRRDVARGASQ